MAITVNSAKKIAYIRGFAEVATKAKKAFNDALGDINSQLPTLGTAFADRSFNIMLSLQATMIEATDAAATFLRDTVVPSLIDSSATLGAALAAEARKAQDDIQEYLAFNSTFSPIAESVIESRGLEENWTPATKRRFEDSALGFISIRKNLIYDIADLTRKNKEEDFAAIYQKIGANLETIANGTVVQYNQLKDALIKIDSDLAGEISDLESGAASASTEASFSAVDLESSGYSV